MDELLKEIERERKRIKGQLRVVTVDIGWLKRGDTIKILDRNISKIKVKSLKTDESGWLWDDEIIRLSEKVEGGV